MNPSFGTLIVDGWSDRFCNFKLATRLRIPQSLFNYFRSMVQHGGETHGFLISASQ